MSKINKQELRLTAEKAKDNFMPNLMVPTRDVLALLDEIDSLESFRIAFTEFHDKTEWVQGDKRFDVITPWVKHRADALKEYIDHLEGRLEVAEKRIALASLEAEAVAYMHSSRSDP